METPASAAPTLPQNAHGLTAEACLAALQVPPEGLTSDGAAARRARFGPNRLPEPKPASLAVAVLHQFFSPFIALLAGAALVSLAMGQPTDAAFILGVVILNALIGGSQEWRAARQTDALRQRVGGRATVLRDGCPADLPMVDLVPGDLVRLETGSRVPADLKLVTGQALLLDESLLTGESLAVAKRPGQDRADAVLGDRASMLHAGTLVQTGRALGVVVATGAETELGRIATALRQSPAPEPPLITRLARFTRRLGAAILLVIALLVAIEAGRGAPLGDVLVVAIALAVSAIPEGLPVAITIALAISVRRMAARNVIVRALPAVEGLGSATLIASDKTGTLTLNRLTVGTVVPAAGLSDSSFAALARRCTEASLGPDPQDRRRGAVGDAVDIAILDWAEGATGTASLPEHGLGAPGVLGSIPYESERKFAAVLHADGDGGHLVVKGALETLLSFCPAADLRHWQEEADRLAGQGYKVIAVAERRIDAGLADSGRIEGLREDHLTGSRLVGLIGLIDPPRPDAADAVAAAQRAGVAVRMITGDHPLTALAIARRLGIADSEAQVVTGRALAAAGDLATFDRLVQTGRVFARIEPLQKLEIVEVLRRQGHQVAVTGDGVNDAPALRAADIGIAMGRSGTDAARDAADLVLTDDAFGSILNGIAEGRVAYSNVRKLIQLLVSTGAAEVLVFVLATLAGLPPPLTAVQLLWLNLVSNGIQDVALAFEKGAPDVLARPPRPPDQPLFDRLMLAQVGLAGAWMGGVSFAVYWWLLDSGASLVAAQSGVMWLMLCFENAHCLNSRSERRSAFRVPVASNPFLLLGILATQMLQVIAGQISPLHDILGLQPMGLADWLLFAAIGLTIIPVMEALKALLIRPRNW